METWTHPFEKSGCGKAPFRVVSFHVDRGPKRYPQKDGTILEIGGPGQPMGSCKHCGANLANVYTIRDCEGKTFTVGCDCVLKTNDKGLAQEVKGFKSEVERIKRKDKKEREEVVWKQILAAKVEEVLVENPGLAEALDGNHRIIRDIKQRLNQWGTISAAQISLVFKLQEQEKVENWIPAPVQDDRVEVTATILSAKTQEDAYGYSYKAFLKVHTDDGNYKSWGTIPDGDWPKQEENEAGVSGQDITLDEMKGLKVKFFARFTVAKDDPTMTFYKRPTKWVWVS